MRQSGASIVAFWRNLRQRLLFMTTVFLLAGWCRDGRAQTAPVDSLRPFVLGVVDTFYSQVLQETRTLNIYLPKQPPASDSAGYPVIYLLDGGADEDFIHIVGIVQFLTMIGKMPPTIVVGIANVDRRRDFTFPTSIAKDKEAFPSSGGSALFIQMIGRELQPFIRKRYPVNGFKTIIGQSLGGLLATEILLKQPLLFNQYIIVSPSLWWDNESLLDQAPTLLSRQAPLQSTVSISRGNEGEPMRQADARLLQLLRAAGGIHFQGYLMPLPEETHLSILHRSVYQALERLNMPVKQE